MVKSTVHFSARVRGSVSALIALLTFMLSAILAGAAKPERKIELGNLVSNSPFGPSRPTAVAENGEPTESMELRGIVAQGGLLNFSIHDVANNRATWYELNKMINGVEVQDYDTLLQTVRVTQQGRSYTLKLKNAIVLAGAPSTAVASGAGAPTGPQMVGGTTRARLVQEERRRAQVGQPIQASRTE